MKIKRKNYYKIKGINNSKFWIHTYTRKMENMIQKQTLRVNKNAGLLEFECIQT